MRLTFKKPSFSLSEKYKVYDDNNDLCFIIKGGLLFGSLFKIFDNNKNNLGCIKQKVGSFNPCLNLFVNGQKIGELNKKSTFEKDEYTLNLSTWEIDENLLETNYQIKDNNQIIAHIKKEKNTFYIDIFNNEDKVKVLLIVLGIESSRALTLY